LDAKAIRAGGDGKTRTDVPGLARLLARADSPRPLLIDIDSAGDLNWPSPEPTPILVDTPWSDRPLPADPALFDALTKALNSDTDTGVATPPHE
ncbi:hypothetical protein ACWD4N_44450, partial [Streptomyces sp. NPDC002586]